ncbi:MAG: DUF177 domain-containing protein [Prevotella sp.]|nr:DUF177 domain-containing protein [Prevotella sp.]
MCSLESFKIDLKGLEATEVVREYSLSDDYFEAIDAPEVKSGSLHVSVTIRKLTGFFELLFHIEGTVRIPCNLCLDDMDQPIETDNRLEAKFGTYESEDDEVVTVDENEGILDLSWLIYEFVALAIPIRHVHAPGKCNPAMLKALEEHSSDRSSDVESDQETDPRWEALRKLTNHP